jgi:hypothetical protein
MLPRLSSSSLIRASMSLLESVLRTLGLLSGLLLLLLLWLLMLWPPTPPPPSARSGKERRRRMGGPPLVRGEGEEVLGMSRVRPLEWELPLLRLRGMASPGWIMERGREEAR